MNSCSIERDGRTIAVIMKGDLTASVISEIQAGLKKELERDTKEVVFDLTATVMLDSSGIGFLVATSNSLGRIQGRISVTGVSADIFQLLQSMRLVSRLNVKGRNIAQDSRGG